MHVSLFRGVDESLEHCHVQHSPQSLLQEITWRAETLVCQDENESLDRSKRHALCLGQQEAGFRPTASLYLGNRMLYNRTVR